MLIIDHDNFVLIQLDDKGRDRLQLKTNLLRASALNESNELTSLTNDQK